MSRRQAYGLTHVEYDAMNLRADGRCEVCRVAPHVNLDHDRTTLRCRGLVCVTCNARLRAVDDGSREATPNEARYLAFPQVGRYGATVGRTMRIDVDLWQSAIAKAKAEGTTLTAVIVTAMREFIAS